MPRLLPVRFRSCWSTSTISLSISIYLVVEQSTLLKQFPCSNRVDVLPILTRVILGLGLNSLHNSLLYVFCDSTSLHIPRPMADTALMRTSYTVPPSRASRRMDVVESGETRLAALQSVLRFLYSTWYWEMVTSLWGVVQVTLRAGFPERIALDTSTPVTWDGTVQ